MPKMMKDAFRDLRRQTKKERGNEKKLEFII